MSGQCPFEQHLSRDSTERVIFISVSAFSGFLSLSGSSLIIYHILRGGRNRLSRIRNRLVLGMSIVDVFYSAAFGLSIIPSPQVTSCSIGMGNLSTCTAQGFFMHLGMAVPAYNAMLSLFFLMTICYNMDQNTIVRTYEPFMHAYAVLPPLITAIIGAKKKLFFNEIAPCWVGDICRSLGTCEEGWGAEFGNGKWLVICTYIFTGTNVIVAASCMPIIYMVLQKINKATRRHAFRSVNYTVVQNQRPSQIEFAASESLKQAFLYFAAFSVTYTWSFVDIVFYKPLHTSLRLPGWYYIVWGATFPLQGFWNFFAYTRPIVSAYRRRENDNTISYIFAIRTIFFNMSNGESFIGGRRRRSRAFDVPSEVAVRDNSSAATAADHHSFQDEIDECYESDFDDSEFNTEDSLESSIQ